MGSKKITVIIIIAVITVSLLLTGIFILQKKSALPEGELEIVDKNGNLIAHFSAESEKIEYIKDSYADYVENVLSETEGILTEKYYAKSDRERLLRSDIRIFTHFSESCFASLESAFNSFNYDDGKMTEAAICTPDGRLLASIAKSNKDNKVTEPHKAGSALKPLSVYAPSLKENIINWATSIEDAPLKKINTDGALRDWPANYEGVYSFKSVSVEYAVKKSLNTVAVRVLNDLTPKKSCDFLEKVGIDVSYEKQLANSGNYEDIYGNLALGELKSGVTAEELASAYQIFANGGEYTKGYCVSEICCDDKTVYTSSPKTVRVIDTASAEIMNLLLQEVVSENGTAAKAEVNGIKIAGKTGTSQGYRDNWFVGLTPQYICSVWYGYGEEQEQRGENEAITVFKNAVTGLDNKSLDFPKSEDTVTAEYCVFSERLAVNGCNQTETGYFNKNNMPEKCNRH